MRTEEYRWGRYKVGTVFCLTPAGPCLRSQCYYGITGILIPAKSPSVYISLITHLRLFHLTYFEHTNTTFISRNLYFVGVGGSLLGMVQSPTMPAGNPSM